MNKLTNVPTTIEPIMAIDNGFCNSDPISEVNNNGTIAKIVVNDVMIIALKRLLPAIWIASNNGFTQLVNSIQFQNRVIHHNTASYNNTDSRHQIQRMSKHP